MRSAILIMATILCLGSASADESLFQRVTVANTLSLEVPTHWKVRDEAERKNLAAATESSSGLPSHVANLSVVSLPEPSGGIIRVSFTDNGGFSQSIIAEEWRRDKTGLTKELEEAFADEFIAMGKSFNQQGIRVLSGPTIEVAVFDGKIGFSLIYQRTSPNGPSTYTVRQHHIPLEKNKAMITLSYRDQDQTIYRQILNRTLASIKFH